jgi:pimeloyl-ACP methyl ester carboxylesterase
MTTIGGSSDPWGFSPVGGGDPFSTDPTPSPEAARAAALADPARTGWPSPRAPNGRVLPCDLSRLDEDALLRPGKKAALYALGSGPADFHPAREPLILVHGISGDPKVLQAVADRFRDDDRFQVYVLCYDDFYRRTSRNGDDMAEELRSLSQRTLGADRPVTVVAHSMGGIVTRRALDRLTAGREGGIDRLSAVRFVSVDTPWHGYDGPPDRGAGGFMMGFVRPFMPDGLEDMRGGSRMFAGDPGSGDPVERAGLFGVELPDHVTTDVVFASEGSEIEDWSEGKLAPLAEKLVGLYARDEPVRGETRLVNFWKAFLDSSAYPRFSAEMRDLADEGKLDAHAVHAALARYLPRFPGDHDGVLRPQPGGGFLDWLERRLERP